MDRINEIVETMPKYTLAAALVLLALVILDATQAFTIHYAFGQDPTHSVILLSSLALDCVVAATKQPH